MGLKYYGICQDCRQYIDLYKFDWGMFTGGGYPKDYFDLSDLEFAQYMSGRFVDTSLRLCAFIARHNGHRLGVYEGIDEAASLLEDDFWRDHLEEVYPWPDPDRWDEHKDDPKAKFYHPWLEPQEAHNATER